MKDGGVQQGGRVDDRPAVVDGGGMKNINRSGTSDARQSQVNELMNKLRKRGKVGSNSDTGASQSFMSRFDRYVSLL